MRVWSSGLTSIIIVQLFPTQKHLLLTDFICNLKIQVSLKMDFQHVEKMYLVFPGMQLLERCFFSFEALVLAVTLLLLLIVKNAGNIYGWWLQIIICDFLIRKVQASCVISWNLVELNVCSLSNTQDFIAGDTQCSLKWMSAIGYLVS